MFDEVPASVDFPALERDVLRFWEENEAWARLRDKNRGRARWSFIDGPITANGAMGVHHAWGRTYKDLFQRYKAMCGYDLRYQNGFDCQGLWVEVEVEKELGFTSKRDIEAYGVARFVEACKERVRRFAALQTEQSIRLGYWMDWDNSYFTMSDENNYTIWHFLKRCHERGLLYRGQDAMPWCPRCSTGLSQHEIATEGYEEITHTAVYFKLPLLDRPGESLLVWTTTPWTLAANVAAEVHADLTYLRVRQGEEVLYVARGAAATALRGDHEVLEELPGSALEGWRYRGPYDDLPAVQRAGAPQAHRVVLGQDVSEGEGTGIVHIAPGCGKEDFELGKRNGLPAIAPLDEFGVYLAGFGALTGQYAESVPAAVVQHLEAEGLLYRAEPFTHRYPVCWRCHTQLVFRLVDEWFISMDGPKASTTHDRDGAATSVPPPSPVALGHEEATPLREQIAAVARKVRWLPPWGLERELDWLRNMGDWMISKKRYWGLALPIWACDACGWFDVVGGEDELRQRAVAGWEAFSGHTPHRPWIDAVKLACPQCGTEASRVPDVGNPWLDAGIVPYSTLGYRQDRAAWGQWFPADFITESFPGQFRNWFYSLLTMSTVLEGREPFRAVLGYGTLRDEQGRDMHKSWGNAIEFNAAADRIGASVMRWIFAGTNPEANLSFGYGVAEEVKRRLLTLWNVYAFFCNYARLDGFDPTGPRVDPAARPAIDRWALGELNVLVAEATAGYDAFDSMTVSRRLEGFIDDLSNWYVRRSRGRFWKNEADDDKAAAYQTLWEVLTTLTSLLAPSMPFLAEAMYQNLVRRVDAAAPLSVHHGDWPVADAERDDPELRAAMSLARQVVGLGRTARNHRARIRVRQPLSALLVRVRDGRERARLEGLAELVAEELNVRRVEVVEETSRLLTYRVKPNFKLLGPLFGPRVNAVAKALQSANAGELARHHAAGEAVTVVVEGRQVEVPAEDFDVEVTDAPGYAVVEEGGYLVALDTRVTPDLVQEGLAREVIHRLNTMRKEAGFRLDDRIVVSYEADDDLRAVLERFGETIRRETLALRLEPALPAEADGYAQDLRLDGHAISLSVQRAGR
jgi:isoleucyl-tRNA synthetase